MVIATHTAFVLEGCDCHPSSMASGSLSVVRVLSPKACTWDMKLKHEAKGPENKASHFVLKQANCKS